MTAAMRSTLAEIWRFMVREGVLRQGVVLFACVITWESFEWSREFGAIALKEPDAQSAAIILAVQAPAAWLAKAVLEWWGKTKPETP